MSKKPEPWKLADKAIQQLNRQAIRRLSETKQQLLIDGFDELNVIRRVNSLYQLLGRDNRRKYRELYIARYLEVIAYIGTIDKPSEDTLDELAEMYLTGLLSNPNELTHYAYDTEVLRKRDKCAEAANAVPGKTQKQIQMDKHLKYWAAQTGFYADFVSEGANIQALKDSGVKQVIWYELNDDKTCSPCKKRNGEIYDIDKIPPKIHPRCRGWVEKYR